MNTNHTSSSDDAKNSGINSGSCVVAIPRRPTLSIFFILRRHPLSMLGLGSEIVKLPEIPDDVVDANTNDDDDVTKMEFNPRRYGNVVENE
ncbi:hypothetical protein LXL04_032552 [Taraxacum kok-saghyz]